MQIFRHLAFGVAAIALTSLVPSKPLLAQGWDVLTPQLNAIEFGRQNSKAARAASGDRSADATSPSTFIGQALSSNLIDVPRSSEIEFVDTTFVYSPARTEQNLRNFVARIPVAAGRADLEQALASQPTLMDDIASGVRSYGFDPHNVADAFAVWWINVWGASEKRNVEPDVATVAAVKRQAYAAFAAMPDFTKNNDAQRQELSEALLLQAAMLGAAFEQNKNNPKMLDQLADAARKGAEASYGIDLQTMTLTSNGFVPRKGADASGAAAGEDPVRNARADAPAGESDSSPLSLALAAGAGLGVTLLGGLALMRRG